MTRLAALLFGLLMLAACGSKPRAPDWQMNAHDALQRSQAAYLKGDARVEAAEFETARRELAATGQVALVARAELTRCAAKVASLVFEACEAFERLRADAPAAERAYADYLQGRIAPPEIALLPAHHRAVASAGAAAVASIEDPLARLVAAGVLMQTGQASPQVLDTAVDTASQQGWRRPLLAWLGVQLRRAEGAGAAQDAERLRRRIALVGGTR